MYTDLHAMKLAECKDAEAIAENFSVY